MSQGSNIGSNLVNGAFVQCAASGGQILLELFGQKFLENWTNIVGNIWTNTVGNVWTKIV